MTSLDLEQQRAQTSVCLGSAESDLSFVPKDSLRTQAGHESLLALGTSTLSSQQSRGAQLAHGLTPPAAQRNHKALPEPLPPHRAEKERVREGKR